MKLPFRDKKFIFLLVSVVIVMFLEVLSLLGIGLAAPYSWIIFGLFILIIGHNVLLNGLKSLIKLRFSSINLLMLIAVVAAFYLGEYSEAAVVIVLYVLGEALEDIGIDNSKSALDELVSNSPKVAIIKGSEEKIAIEKIAVDTIIIVKPHEIIPLDGDIVFGETAVDESSITGEPIPKTKFIGNTVYAGTLNKSGYIEVKVKSTAKDTTLSKIIELTFEAQKSKSNSEQFIKKFARYYTPFIIFIATMLFLVPVFIMGLDLHQWLNQAISILVIGCPCALVISTPVAIYAAIGNASSKGALVKGGKYIEAMSAINAICLDKTRTITYGNPVVSDIFPLNGADRTELLACTAGIELFSEHPLAQAIVDIAKRENIIPHKVEMFESVVGKGAKAHCLECNHHEVLAGTLAFIAEHHKVDSDVEKIVEQLSSEGKTSVVISCGAKITGIIGLTDEIKPESADAIKDIKALGITPIMLTGDNRYSADFIAHQVGIKEVYGNLLPQDKVSQVMHALSTYKNVAMVGDGVNDAPALAQSTVGIAMGAMGSGTAIEVANIALMNDKLTSIPKLVVLAKKTVNTIRFNTILAILVKIIFIALAMMGHANLVLAITADVGVTLLVILVSLRLLRLP